MWEWSGQERQRGREGLVHTVTEVHLSKTEKKTTMCVVSHTAVVWSPPPPPPGNDLWL